MADTDSEDEEKITEVNDAGEKVEEDVKGIPSFWLTIFQVAKYSCYLVHQILSYFSTPSSPCPLLVLSSPSVPVSSPLSSCPCPLYQG